MSGRDTIFALSSGRPPAAVAVIRISGPGALAAASSLAGALPAPRTASLRQLRHARTGELLDDALVLRFDAPASATGEDVVEFQCHGGRAIVDAILGALSEISGLRAAEPGEFTRRAFENGRIDLTEAEGLADLIEAETEAQRKAAIILAEGGLRQQISQWNDRLLALSARAERAIDYDEDDEAIDPALTAGCEELSEELRAWLKRPRAEPLKEGVQVVVAGQPNTGKSSLINVIIGEERAIVTDIPGTTRDYIDVPIALGGLPIRLTDTAGIRDAQDEVEAIGVDRAIRLTDLADVLLWLGDPADGPSHPRRINVHSKSDLAERKAIPPGSVAVSAKTGEGLDDVIVAIERHARTILPAEGAIALNRRQADHISEVAVALARAAVACDAVLLAEGVRSARMAFDRLTGRAGVEDVLDALFGRFCLGK